MTDVEDPGYVAALLGDARANGHRAAASDDARARRTKALVDGFRASDVGNADRLVAAAGHRIRYVHKWQKWLVYEHGRWVIDFGGARIAQVARDVAHGIYLAALDLDDALVKPHQQWAAASERSTAIAAMIHLARGAPGVLIEHDELDTHPWLLNVANGTLDLRTGVLGRHQPEHLLTVQAPVEHDSDAAAPLWEHCLARWQPDPDVRGYLQRAVGTGLTGHPLEYLFVNHGDGSNGKTKFYEALAGVLGDYAVTPSKGVFVEARHDDHKTELASLHGARMLVLGETEHGDRLNEAKVKNLTGGDSITCRRMREDEWSFRPTHTAFVHTNHRPRVTGTDHGMWRRLRLIEWSTRIADDERDDALGAKLRTEAPGILRWVLAGCLDWQRRGLDEPPAVTASTAGYRYDEDHVGRFLADCCRTAAGLRIRVGRLRELYEQWCDQAGEDAWSQTRLGLALTNRGIGPSRVGGVGFREGVDEL